MYMGAHTQINAAVFITMCGGFRAHMFVCVHIQGPQPGMATHPGAKKKKKKKPWLTIFLFQIYIYIYINLLGNIFKFMTKF